ncbi:MAG: hypothetical protein KAR20_16050, partial [Candidatus Heimdallarchaeota archaeon]|nr:hypothetical protein [Candidatus Heimdallarchaeota archaeon]
ETSNVKYMGVKMKRRRKELIQVNKDKNSQKVHNLTPHMGFNDFLFNRISKDCKNYLLKLAKMD